jgi:hypothetical protein
LKNTNGLKFFAVQKKKFAGKGIVNKISHLLHFTEFLFGDLMLIRP